VQDTSPKSSSSDEDKEVSGGSLTRAQQMVRRRPGGKPDIRRLKELDLVHSPGHRLMDFTLDDDAGEWDSPSNTRRSSFDSDATDWEDWESEPRASSPESGDPMDGEDVGCPPDRRLTLPCAAIAQPVLNAFGRSLLVLPKELQVPKAAPSSRSGRPMSKMPTPPWRKSSKLPASSCSNNKFSSRGASRSHRKVGPGMVR